MTADLATRRFTAQRLWLALVFFTAVAAYALTIGHGFAFDDGVVIEKNLDIRSLGNLPQIFAHGEWEGAGMNNGLYRPLTTATYALNYAVAGLSPWSYHLVNVVLHGLVSALVVLLGLRWRLTLTAAGLAGLLFAVHPLHVEAVANVVGRKDLLAALFVILMVLGHIRAVRIGGWSLCWAPLAFVAAMLSKEVGVVGIGLVALHDLFLPEVRPAVPAARRRARGLYALYALLLLSFLAAHRAVAGALPDALIPFIENPAGQAALSVRWMTAIAVIGKGLGLHLIPLNLSPDYSYAAIPLVESAFDLRVLGTVLVMALWLWLSVRLRRRAPAVGLGLGWHALAILPVSNLLFPTGTIFGERLLYLPGAGLLLVVALAVHALLIQRSRRAGLVFTGAALTLLSVATVRYSAAWGDELRLFSLAADHQPRSAKAHYKKAELLFKLDRREEALEEARIAFSISRELPRAGILMAEVLIELGSLDEAESVLGDVLRVEPEEPDALHAMGRIWRDRTDYERAEGYWRQALASDPEHALSLVDLGTLSLLRSDTPAAIDYLSRGLSADSLNAAGWYNLGLALERSGQAAAARQAFRRFIETAGPGQERALLQARQRLESP